MLICNLISHFTDIRVDSWWHNDTFFSEICNCNCNRNQCKQSLTQSMFIEPEATKEPKEGGTRKATAAGSQFPTSQGAVGKAQGR